jgi:L-cysteine S-thiosulfotransferase
VKIKQRQHLAAVLGLVLLSPPALAADEIEKATAAVIKNSFRAEGQAKLEWLEQDPAQKACSGLAPPPADVVRKIEAEQLASVKWPAGGSYLGDWKEGEKIAQSGRGMTWTDKATDVNGGGCYNCHQISKEEISFGTIGPSLLNYGKLRGVADPSATVSETIIKYTWAKIYNAKSYNACSTMPRIGHAGVLTEKQIQDVMALLLDPKSPVNQ